MSKIIEVKKELEGLKYDIDRALECGQDPEQLLTLAMKKISNIFKMDSKEYFKMVWTNDK